MEELDQENEERRGRNLSLVNNTLPVAQILVGSLAGVAITALGGSSTSGSDNEHAIGRLFVVVGLGISALLLVLFAVDWALGVIPVR